MSKLKNPFPEKMNGLWIPRAVMILSAQGRITPLEMLLLSQIASFGEKGTWIHNSTLAARFNQHKKRAVQVAISSLKKQGMIESVGPDRYHRLLRVSSAYSALLSDEVAQNMRYLPDEVAQNLRPSSAESAPQVHKFRIISSPPDKPVAEFHEYA